MIEDVKKHQAVEKYKEWKKNETDKEPERIYLELKGKKPFMAGDKNTKIYLDVKKNIIKWRMGKGICSKEFNMSIDMLKEDFPFERVY